MKHFMAILPESCCNSDPDVVSDVDVFNFLATTGTNVFQGVQVNELTTHVILIINMVIARDTPVGGLGLNVLHLRMAHTVHVEIRGLAVHGEVSCQTILKREDVVLVTIPCCIRQHQCPGRATFTFQITVYHLRSSRCYYRIVVGLGVAILQVFKAGTSYENFNKIEVREAIVSGKNIYTKHIGLRLNALSIPCFFPAYIINIAKGRELIWMVECL